MWPRAGNWPCNGHAHAACSTRAICCDLELPAGWGVLLHTLLHRRGCYYRSYYRLRRCISALLHCARFVLASYYNRAILYQRVYYTYGDTRAITSTSALCAAGRLAESTLQRCQARGAGYRAATAACAGDCDRPRGTPRAAAQACRGALTWPLARQCGLVHVLWACSVRVLCVAIAWLGFGNV